MHRMLEELFFGNINPNERQFIPDAEYTENMKIIADNEEQLTGILLGKEKRLFLEFLNAQSSVSAIAEIENFIIGFKLGVRIGIEVMDNEDGVLQDIT